MTCLTGQRRVALPSSDDSARTCFPSFMHPTITTIASSHSIIDEIDTVYDARMVKNLSRKSSTVFQAPQVHDPLPPLPANAASLRAGFPTALGPKLATATSEDLEIMVRLRRGWFGRTLTDSFRVNAPSSAAASPTDAATIDSSETNH